jgi:tetratricopeptide (TPR) repeat protein
LAYQFAQAGNKEKAIKYALAAGQDALAKWSNNEAVKHFTFVVQALEEKPSSKVKLVALEGLGDAYFAVNNFQQAITFLERVADEQDDSGKIRALRKALSASFYQGDVFARAVTEPQIPHYI